MAKNTFKNRNGVVFSTNPDFDYEYDEQNEPETLEPQNQNLKVCRDSKQRKGKTVTLVKNFVGKEQDLKDLSKILKNKCGVGGSVKNNEIIIQGNMTDQVIEILKKLNYKVKKSGA